VVGLPGGARGAGGGSPRAIPGPAAPGWAWIRSTVPPGRVTCSKTPGGPKAKGAALFFGPGGARANKLFSTPGKNFLGAGPKARPHPDSMPFPGAPGGGPNHESVGRGGAPWLRGVSWGSGGLAQSTHGSSFSFAVAAKQLLTSAGAVKSHRGGLQKLSFSGSVGWHTRIAVGGPQDNRRPGAGVSNFVFFSGGIHQPASFVGVGEADGVSRPTERRFFQA